MKRLTCFLVGFLISVSARGVVVLQYHHVSEVTPETTSISPELFEKHLDYLVEQRFDVIGLDELAELIREGAELPDHTAVITFDDGYNSVYDHAWPALKKRGLPFAVFINTQPHDRANANFMSWEQMRQMAAQGVVFANHTVSHPHLIRRLQDESVEQWRKRVWHEISTAEQTIQRQLGQHHRLLAYPFGEYNAALQKTLAEHGYLAFGQQSGPLAPYSHPQALPRFPFGGIYGAMDDFAVKVNTLPLPFEHLVMQSEKGQLLTEPELPGTVKRPELIFTFANTAQAKRLTCFASGQGRIATEVKDAKVVVQAGEALPSGRSRYNCTASSGKKSRFYWYSAMFIRRLPRGEWYRE